MADPYRYFRVEAREILDQLQKQLLELEKGTAPPDTVKSMLRLAHTLKGAARVVKQREIGELSHSLEDLLVTLRDDPATDAASITSRGLGIVDAIEARLSALDTPPPAPKSERPQPSPATADAVPLPALERAARTDLEELGLLVTGVQEVSSRLAALGRTLAGFTHGKNLAELVVGGLTARSQDGGKRQLEQTRSLADELSRLLPALERELTTGVEQATRELEQVHETAERLRLVPASSMFGALERTARDVAVSLGKLVQFSAKGGDVRLDASLLSVVQSALVQAVRNAVAHGVESPGQRSAAGKAREGVVSVDVTRRDRFVVFSCRDDGRGLDLEAIRRAVATRSGANAEHALDDRSVIELLLKGGISTAGAVTAVSGRGVGLDLLRETAERTGGKLSLESHPGGGTVLHLAVPATLAALEALTLEVAGQVVSVPLDSVRRTLRVVPEELVRGADGERLRVEDALVPFSPLAELLGFDADAPQASRNAVVVEGSTGRVALGVDRLLGTETAVARAVPEIARAKSVVLAASLDTRGNPRLLLDPHELVVAAKQRGLPSREAAKTRAPILVIDDSLTTRMLEQSILESAGYEVDLATSAEEGLSMAARRRYALFLVDVEMPGMDGFTFVERTRRDPRFSAIPAILVTSRASPEDLERGRSAGAAAHIVKSEFDQADFLARIRRLVG